MTLSFQERARLQHNPTGQKLFFLMAEKQTNLAISADVTTSAELIEIADTLGPKICILKTHMDIISDWSITLIEKLTALAKAHNFLIFEDRKFADIGNTVQLQYEGGTFKISSWADMVNFHIVSGSGILDGLKGAKAKRGRGFIVLAQMSSSDNLITGEYTEKAIAVAEQNPDEVFGFICLEKLVADPRFLHLTPGVKIAGGKDDLGQQYRTPEIAIGEQGCDIIIVGRGILESANRLEMAEQYRSAAWNAYTHHV